MSDPVEVCGSVHPQVGSLRVLELNPFHNVGHLVTGMAGLLLASTLGRARVYDWLLVVSHLGLLAFGLL